MIRRATLTAATAAAALAASGPAAAAPLGTRALVERHVAALGNADKVVADFAPDAVVLQDGHAVQGKPAIRAMFAKIFSGPFNLKVVSITTEGNVGTLTWTAPGVTGTDVYITRGGKIVVEAVWIKPVAGPMPAVQ